MEFRYIKYGETLRPVIPVRVKLKDLDFQYEVLIDSGADFCLFHAEVAEYLGIDLRKCKKGLVTGVGGKSSEYFLHEVSIEVGGWNYSMEVGFLPTIGGRSAPYGIVGQKGFFENFIVKFDFKKEEIELKPRT
ncbi:MAG: retropepsin-like aspartic protease [Candidatus Paceibacterota bacterium]|jgi:predicted aspartyl protease